MRKQPLQRAPFLKFEKKGRDEGFKRIGLPLHGTDLGELNGMRSQTVADWRIGVKMWLQAFDRIERLRLLTGHAYMLYMRDSRRSL